MSKENRDFAFENKILEGEKAALEKELETAQLAAQTAHARLAKLTPVANRAAALKTENDNLKAIAAANAKVVADGQEAINQWRLHGQAHEQLRNNYNSVITERDAASQAMTRSKDEANILKEQLAVKKREVENLSQMRRTEAAKSDRLKTWLVGTTTALVVCIAGAGAGYYVIRTPPAELTAEATVCWNQHHAEYKQMFNKVWEQRVTDIRAQAERSAFFTDDERRWGFADYLRAAVFWLIGVVIGIFVFPFLAWWLWRS